jgi:hypothetical protein
MIDCAGEGQQQVILHDQISESVLICIAISRYLATTSEQTGDFSDLQGV